MRLPRWRRRRDEAAVDAYLREQFGVGRVELEAMFGPPPITLPLPVWGRDDSTAARLVRGEPDADLAALAADAQPLDVVDGPRSAREVHGMTVPEFLDINATFADIVAENWPQT